MKKAQFAPGFAELRGNISGKQNLEYPTNNNKAYDGPIGRVNYARNYRAAVVVSQRAKDGQFYFTVRTKSANHLTAKSKKAMALLGGAGAIYAALLKAPTLKANAQAVYVKAQELGDARSFRAFMMDYIRTALIAHSSTISLAIAGASVSIDNPWAKFSGDLNISVSNAVRVKFWTELVTNGIAFTVGGMKGVAVNGNDFADVIDSNYNVLTLDIDASDYVRLGSATGAYILDGTEYINSGVTATNGAAYTTTDQAPA